MSKNINKNNLIVPMVLPKDAAKEDVGAKKVDDTRRGREKLSSADMAKMDETKPSDRKQTNRSNRASTRKIRRQRSFNFERGREPQRAGFVASGKSSGVEDVYTRMQSLDDLDSSVSLNESFLMKLMAPHRDTVTSEESASEAVTPIEKPLSRGKSKKKASLEDELIFGPLSFEEPKIARQKVLLKRDTLQTDLDEDASLMYPMPVLRKEHVSQKPLDIFASLGIKKHPCAVNPVESFRGQQTPAWLVSKIIIDIKQEHLEKQTGIRRSKWMTFEPIQEFSALHNGGQDAVDDVTREFMAYEQMFKPITRTVSALALDNKDKSNAARRTQDSKTPLSFSHKENSSPSGADTKNNPGDSKQLPLASTQVRTGYTNPVYRLNLLAESQPTTSQSYNKPLVFTYRAQISELHTLDET